MNGKTFPRWVGPLVVLLGVGSMAIGISRGEMTTVFDKAVRICLECIGIG